MLFITICLTLLTLIAAMHLLAKTQKESLGSLFKWISYVIIIVSLLILVCEITRGVRKMTCRDGEKCGKKGMPMGHRMMMRGMYPGHMDECMMGRGGMKRECCEEEMECEEHMKGGGMKGGCDDDDDEHEGGDSTHKMMHHQ